MTKSNMDQDILKVLYSEEQLKTRVQEMGDELYERLKDKNPLFLGVLKGSFIFMADIVRACQLKSDIEFIAVSSYQNATTSSGVVQITRDLQQDITAAISSSSRTFSTPATRSTSSRITLWPRERPA